MTPYNNKTNMKELIEQWKRMETAGDPKATDFLKEITARAQAEGKIQEMNEAISFLMGRAEKHLANIEESVTAYTIHEQMGELSEAINLAYIARRYFGKTRQWLYQRVKGQIVNGKPASFTPDEEARFKFALNEIGLQIATVTRRV